MKIIDTSQITDPNVQQPFTGLSLSFLQNATMEVLNSLAQALSNRYGGTGSDKYVLWGLERSGTVGAYTFTEGWFYDQVTAQIYYCAGNGGIASSNPYMNIAVNNGAANIFSDGTTKYVNKDYYTVMSTSSHSPICQYTDLLFNFRDIKTAIVQGQSGESATSTGQVLKFATNVIDPNSWYDATTGKFTPSIAGYYEVSSGIVLSIAASLSSFLIELDVNKNGTFLATLALIPYSGNYTPGNPNGSFIVLMNGTTDYLTVSVGLTSSQAWANSGVASKVSYKLIQPQF